MFFGEFSAVIIGFNFYYFLLLHCHGAIGFLSDQSPNFFVFARDWIFPNFSFFEYFRYHQPRPFFIISSERYFPLSKYTFAIVLPYLSFWIGWYIICFPNILELVNCFAFFPKGCYFRGSLLLLILAFFECCFFLK